MLVMLLLFTLLFYGLYMGFTNVNKLQDPKTIVPILVSITYGVFLILTMFGGFLMNTKNYLMNIIMLAVYAALCVGVYFGLHATGKLSNNMLMPVSLGVSFGFAVFLLFVVAVVRGRGKIDKNTLKELLSDTQRVRKQPMSQTR